MIKAASLSIDVNLFSFSALLKQQGLQHRIIEESGSQVIWVNTEAEADLVRRALEGWSEVVAKHPEVDVKQQGIASIIPGTQILRGFLGALISSPISMLLIIISVAVALLSGLGSAPGRVQFLFYPLLDATNLLSLLGSIDSPGRVLRSITPMFLHFGELHLVFNMIWLWYFGRQLEPIHPRWLFLLVIIITSFVSNTSQYLFTTFNNFGGMSGVVYGLVGYTWVVHLLMPRSNLTLRNNMFVVFIVALVLMEFVAGSWIATAAHVGGLVSGLLFGLVVALFYRVVLRREVISR